jgi:hypothetical protein
MCREVSSRSGATMNLDELAKVAYETFRKTVGHGSESLPFDHLKQRERNIWRAVASAVSKGVQP